MENYGLRPKDKNTQHNYYMPELPRVTEEQKRIDIALFKIRRNIHGTDRNR